MPSEGLVIQAVVTGLAAGAVYGLVAIGFCLVYRLTAVFQLAHGALIGAAAFLMIAITFGTAPALAGGVPSSQYALAAAIVLCASAVMGIAVYGVAVRPFRTRAIGWIGATAAVALAIEGVLAALFPREAYALPDALPFGRWHPISLPGGASVAPRTLYVLASGSKIPSDAKSIYYSSFWRGQGLS